MAEQSEEPEQTADQEEREVSMQTESQLKYYASVIGAFKDNPMLDAMMANIRERKQKMNADDNIS